MSRDLTAAFLARLRLDPVLADSTHKGVVPLDADGNRPELYATVFTDTGTPTVDRYVAPYHRLDTTFWVHYVASDPEQAEALTERGDAQLINWVPEVAGWQCRRVRPAAAQPIQMDDTVKPPLFFVAKQYDLTAYPRRTP